MISSPIGFFDSGVGGLTIWQQVVNLLPNESTVYIADQRYAPYGSKNKDIIFECCKRNVDFLLKKGCKLIVVACNTATTNVIALLRAIYDVPLVGVEPPIKPAAMATKTGVVGVLATKPTLNSPLFSRTLEEHLGTVKLIKQHGEGLVDLIENGKTLGTEVRELLIRYLYPMQHSKVDWLVLGCTHYSFLIPLIQEITNHKINIIDAGIPVAKRVVNILATKHILGASFSPIHHFYSTGSVDLLKSFIRKMPLPILDTNAFFETLA